MRTHTLAILPGCPFILLRHAGKSFSLGRGSPWLLLQGPQHSAPEHGQRRRGALPRPCRPAEAGSRPSPQTLSPPPSVSLRARPLASSGHLSQQGCTCTRSAWPARVAGLQPAEPFRVAAGARAAAGTSRHYLTNSISQPQLQHQCRTRQSGQSRAPLPRAPAVGYALHPRLAHGGVALQVHQHQGVVHLAAAASPGVCGSVLVERGLGGAGGGRTVARTERSPCPKHTATRLCERALTLAGPYPRYG